MKKFFYFLFITSSIIVCKGQNDGVEIIYKVKPKHGSIDNDQKIKNDGMSIFFSGVDDELSNIEYKLCIAKNNISYELNKYLSKSKNAYLIAIGLTGGGNFYCSNNDCIQIKKIDDKNYFVIDNNDFKWKITKDEKKISGYNCIKAIGNVQHSLEKTISIEAWFCPELPFQYGPKNFKGLPGLILEAYDDKIIYYAQKISFNKDIKLNNKIFIEPKISKEEFLDIINELNLKLKE